MKMKIMRMVSSFFAFIAIIYATAPCHGKFYEPEMPEELIK